MEVQGRIQGVVAVLVLIAGVCSSSVSFGTVCVYDGGFNLLILDEGRMADAVIDVKDHCNIYGTFSGFLKGSNTVQIISEGKAQVPVEMGEASFTGRFRPIEPYRLLRFDDQGAYGCWQLQVYDAFYADVGAVNRCELMIMNPEPTTALLLVVGVCLMLLQSRRRNQ